MKKYTLIAEYRIGMKSLVMAVLAFCLLFTINGLSLAEQQRENGPLVYGYNLKGPVTMELEAIKTQGTISEISAYWESEGEVSLEASANAGLYYTKIVNGQPLTNGFMPGNSLRFKVYVGQDSLLKRVIIGYKDNSGEVRAYKNPDLAGFKYYRLIYISAGSEELFNYPLKINVQSEDYAENVQSVYFTAADGQTRLDYYIEQGLSPQGTVPNFWVKIPQIPKEGTMLYLYYGYDSGVIARSDSDEAIHKRLLRSARNDTENAGRNDTSLVSLRGAEGDEAIHVFPFFDDFSAKELDRNKWLLRPQLNGGYRIKDGALELMGYSIISREFKMKKGILEFKAKADKDCAIEAIVRGRINERVKLPLEQIVYSSAFPGAEHTIAIDNVVKLNAGNPIKPGVYYIYKVIVNEQGIIFERYDENYYKQAETRFLETDAAVDGYIGLKADSAGFNQEGKVYFKFIRVRPYVEIEPKVRAIGDRLPIGSEDVPRLGEKTSLKED